MRRRRGLVRTAARTAVIAGTATSVAGRVQRRQQQKLPPHASHVAPTGTIEAAVQHASNSSGDIVGSLQRLAELKASGALSDKEYAAAKARVLAM
jgi:hypothetical protein